MTESRMPLLAVKDLHTYFETDEGVGRAVDGVSFTVDAGRTLGILGESGCGKSVTALSILRLVTPPGRVVAGEIRYRGEDLLRRSERQMRAVRGGEIAMIFQEPMTSLNPVFTIGNQIGEAIRLHQRCGRSAVRARVVEALRRVEIPEPERRARSYPHELSGGMRQRAMIAMALACEPSLLIADEPTTALDVTIQAQILELLRNLRSSLGMAMVLITHDLGIVAEQADAVAVMYAGRIVEYASALEVFERPLHPYAIALMQASGQRGGARHRRLEALPGTVPSLFRRPSGCRFRDRCPRAIAACAEVDPMLEEKAPGHTVACIRV
ncbi:MAG: peptide ABC transporter ATP-binding protein [Polyangiaceae bacterium UTPRO1]|nr:ABC transporter ATP-binding protein [Myxococcales bacterium]OQY64842.1 MAG: peptide ABC transporter ATP-binding protein [Polyangiaceae bacterium UTPRO1]